MAEENAKERDPFLEELTRRGSPPPEPEQRLPDCCPKCHCREKIFVQQLMAYGQIYSPESHDWRDETYPSDGNDYILGYQCRKCEHDWTDEHCYVYGPMKKARLAPLLSLVAKIARIPCDMESDDAVETLKRLIREAGKLQTFAGSALLM